MNSESLTQPLLPSPPSNKSSQITKPVQPPTAASTSGYRLPENTTLQHASKLAIVEDKPIMLDYWTYSLEKTVLIGVREDNQEKLLVKSEEEYTSPISKIYKVGKEYIIITENSIYIVDVEIPTKKISA
jgi:hypothetical protein